MKAKILVGVAAISLMGCTQNDILDKSNNNGNEVMTVTLTPPDALNTRAVSETSNSALGGISNVDWAMYDLRYQLAVYDETGETQIISPQVKIAATGYQPVTYELRLIPGQNYKLVAWADFVNEGDTADLHYNTADLRNIVLIDDLSAQMNDESRDAYFGTQNLTAGNNFNETITLKRPFAKLRVVTTDWAYENLPMPDNFKVTYYNCTRFEGINAVTGEALAADGNTAGSTIDATGIELATTIRPSKEEKYYKAGYDKTDANRTVIVDYLLCNDEQQPIHFKIGFLDGNNTLIERDLNTNVPIQRNWLTTIIGNMLTTGGNITINIDEGFVNDFVVGEEWWDPNILTPTEPEYDAATKTYRIKTRDEFAWLPDNIDNIASGTTFIIENDIDMGGMNWKPIYPSNGEPSFTVEGQGHTLRNFTLDGTYGAKYYIYNIFFIANAYQGVWGKFQGTMRNLTFENITINGRACDMVDTDVDGNPVDHSQEYAYFAGCIGYTGQNWSTTAIFENVHAKHVYIKASNNKTTQNIGGLIGWIGVGGGNTKLTNCSAEDIHITGYQAGGLVGQVVGSRYVGFTDCRTEDIYLRVRSASSYKTTSGFIGLINNGGTGNGTTGANNIIITSCQPATHVEFINDATGAPIDYTPASQYYGTCETNESGVIINE